jgi:leader peptidase (prepilin peptidase)/N-methyltransferase
MEALGIETVISYIPLWLQICFYSCIFFMGASFSDFFQCMIYRHTRHIDLFIKRSFCDSCGRQLKWYHLVPVISYFVARGKCAFCGSPVNVRYAMADIFSGLIAVLLVRSRIAVLFCMLYAILLVLMTAHDFLSQRVPLFALCLFYVLNLSFGFLFGGRADLLFFGLEAGAVLLLLGLVAVFRKAVFRVLSFLVISSLALSPLKLAMELIAALIAVIACLLFIAIKDRKITHVAEIPYIALLGLGFVVALVL